MSDPTWRTVPFHRLFDRDLLGRTMRVLSRVEGRDELVVMAQGPYGGMERDGQQRLYVDVIPDPDAPLLADEAQRELARTIRARRAADTAAGRDPGRELWGPLGLRTVVQIATDPTDERNRP